MATVDWASDSDSDSGAGAVVDDTPRKLSKKELDTIVNGLRLAKNHTRIQANIVHIHQDKTRKKLQTIKIKPSKSNVLREEIWAKFYEALVANGEAVGVNGAQCIGEPTTQMTLNSVAPTERLIIQDQNGLTRVVEIGSWIDGLLASNQAKIRHIPENRTEYLELEHPVWTPTPAENGSVGWDQITAITRHLPVGDLVKITSQSGRTVTATRSKSLLIWDGEKLVQKGGADVKIDDLVPVICQFPEPKIISTHSHSTVILDYNLGVSVGEYLSTNKVQNIPTEIIDLLGTGNSKIIPGIFYTAPLNFVKGVLTGYNCKVVAGDHIVIETCSNEMAIGISVLYSRLDIFGHCMNNHVIISKSIDISKDFVNGDHFINSEKLPTTVLKRQGHVILDPIVKIENVPATAFVYDLTVPSTTNFSLWNGLGVADTFHSAGVSAKNAALGYPRAQELFAATKSPANPTTTICFTESNESPAALHKLVDRLPFATVETLLATKVMNEPSAKGQIATVKQWVVYSPEDYPFDYWQTAWFKLHPTFEDLTENEWCLRLTFNVEKLYEHDLTIKDIAAKLANVAIDMRCIYSPLNVGIIDVIVNCSEVYFNGSETDDGVTDDESAGKKYMNKIVAPKIRSEIICGISGISKVYRRKASVDEHFGGFPLKPEIAARLTKNTDEWIAETDGTNLAEILAQPGVDSERTISNDMWEIMNIFGIEAARTYLLIEFYNIVQNSGIGINPVHLTTLIDKMTYTGSIRAIARYGVETAQYEPIARATFEEVMSSLVTSAMFSENDSLAGISSNIIVGTPINAGTGKVTFEEIEIRVVRPKKEKVESNLNTKISSQHIAEDI